MGIASRLIPGKGHDVLLAAFASAHNEIPELRLMIAGDGPLRSELERSSQHFGPAVGVCSALWTTFAASILACDVVAFPTLPTLGEGFGLARSKQWPPSARSSRRASPHFPRLSLTV